jgi:inward rectifier potassium channel
MPTEEFRVGGRRTGAKGNPLPIEPGEETRDLGFGRVVSEQARQRLINKDGSTNVRRVGLPFFEQFSPYHAALNLSWTKFLFFVALVYILVNAVFAVAYFALGPGALAGTEGDPDGLRLMHAFFFSVQTFATIGYGQIGPHTMAANFMTVFEALVGLLGVALLTGLLFARFAKPNAAIRFSSRALIAPFRDITAFEFRIVNKRLNELIDLHARVLMARFEERDGHRVRRYLPLTLEREGVMFFPLSWTIVHPIDTGSPLWGLTAGDLEAMDAEFLVLLSATDETFAAQVHARSSYKADEVVWHAKFADMFVRSDAQPDLAVDSSKLDDYYLLPDAPGAP